ncbi:MAG: C_GCAxxG_C_C family protein [Lachnospiraceae bacterium]|jgi:C_GCAxxG_C_C family probable redox protein|nr:C_GCAxxG_C_C family protein [Lachnospiraceae bacterium]
MDYGNSKYGQKAEENFLNGYNCTQAVFLAFSDLHGMDGKTAARLSSSFGGGMGRLREVCGAASGMFLVAGMLYGYEKPGDAQGKKEHYARIQQLAKAYEAENGSIVCRELLGLTRKRDEPVPESRTEEYYKKRPCKKLVRMAAAIMEQYIKEHPLEGTEDKSPQ